MIKDLYAVVTILHCCYKLMLNQIMLIYYVYYYYYYKRLNSVNFLEIN